MINAELLIGTVIDNRYRLTRKIGKGSYGWVFEAVEEMAGSYVGQVAVKLLAPEDDMQREMVLREIRALAGLTHEHIIAYRTSGVINEGTLAGTIFLVTELGECALSQCVPPQDRLSEEHIWDMGRRVAAALAHIHEKKSVHRDVKPENVLRVNGHWKLGDFGLVRAVEGAQMSASGAKGTLRYMAPEVMTNEITDATDVYALGVTLLRCLTGQYAHSGETEGEFIGNLMTKPSQVPPDLSVSWRTILRGCLEREPQRRWTAAHLTQQLELGPALSGEARAASANAWTTPVPTTDPDPLEDRTIQLVEPVVKPVVAPVLVRPPSQSVRPPVSYTSTPLPTAEVKLRLEKAEVSDPFTEMVPRKKRRKRFPAKFILYGAVVLLLAGGVAVFATHSSTIGNMLKPTGSDATEWVSYEDAVELTVLADRPVHVRTEPRSDAKSLGILTRDANVRTVGKEGEWYQIQMPTGGMAFIHDSAFLGTGSEGNDFESLETSDAEIPTQAGAEDGDRGAFEARSPNPEQLERNVSHSPLKEPELQPRERSSQITGNNPGASRRAMRAKVARALKKRCQRRPDLPICGRLKRLRR